MLNPIRGMEIFIEKEILEKLNKDFLSDNLTLGQKSLREILTSYSEIKFCTNFSLDNFQLLEYKSKNPLFNSITIEALYLSYDSINDFISKSSFKQVIILDSKENYKIKDLIESKGGLYLTYDNYSEKIEEIIEHFHKKIDLSEQFVGWQQILNKTFLKINEIIINDNYLIKDINNINNYILPLVKSVKKQCKLNRIIFITDYLNHPNYQKEAKLEILKKELRTSYVEILHNNFISFSNHDRVLYTNFLMIDCPIGFNQVDRLSNSIINIETIFNKFTYNRRRRHYSNFQKLITDKIY
jgi:hypothetical protein